MQTLLFLKSRRRLLAWLGGLLLSYTLIGFFLLPWLVETQLAKILDERLSLSSQVESVYFNPFSFYFEMEELRVSDPERDTLLHLGELQLNFQPSRLALLKLQFAEIRIGMLDIYYTRDSSAEDTISRLAQRWSSTAEPAADTSTTSETGELVPLEILSLSLSSINAHIVDAVPATPFSTTLSLAQAQIDNFSTLPDQSGNNTLAIHFEEDAELTWSGGFTVNPLDFRGEVTLSNFSLLPVYRYLQDSLPFRLDRGHVDLAFNYDIDLSQGDPQIQIEQIEFALNDLAATQTGAAQAFVEATRLSLSEGQVALPQNRAEFSSLSLAGLSVNATRNASGQLDLQEMIEAMLPAGGTGAQQAEPVSEAATNTWSFSLASLSLENNRASFVDNSLETPFSIATTLDANVREIDNQAGSQFPFTTALSLDSGGSIELSGSLQALPSLNVESALSLSDIAVSVAQPYVNEFAFLELESGTLNLESEIAVNSDEPFSIRGGVTLNEVEITDQQLNETLFSMSSLGVDAMSLSLADNNLDISELALSDFFARVLINEDGSSNIGRSIKSGEVSPAEAAEPSETDAAASPFAVTVGRVRLDNASANFTDLNLPLPFHADIQGLAGTVQGFASNSSQATDINLEGQVDEFGLVQIESSLNPFNFAAQSQIDVNFSNIDMPSMTPYVIKFAGREIAEGKVDVGLHYSLLEGELTANNQVVLSALQLGERVEQAGAMDLPLDLAIALLKDGNGVIDLEVPITGDVNDPEFDFGPAIRRAVTNILTNIVAAPFRLLGNLVGGGDEGSLEQIRFLPGRADIAAPEQEILLTLGEALQQRPQLLLEIPAITAEADELALQIAATDAAIESQLEAMPESDESLTARRMVVMETLYAAAGLIEPLDAIRLLHTQIADTASSPVPEDAAAQLDNLAYIADLRERIIAATEIGESDLSALGSARRQSVIDFLSTRAGISPARLLETELVMGEEDDDGWLVLPFGLTAQ